ncbi:MAG: hypothetical protein U1F10_08745 [Burkholderiales bacterium]
MPHATTWEDSGVYVRFWGHASIADVFAMMEEVGADPRFDVLRYILADYRDVREQSVTPHEVEEVAALGFAHSLTNPHYLHVAVATDTAVVALLGHWKATVAHPDRVAYFPSLQEAREWIRVQPSPSAPRRRA